MGWIVEPLVTDRTPALLMAAATMNIPAICMNVGPMLNGAWWQVSHAAEAETAGYDGPRLIGSGGVVWDNRKLLSSGVIDQAQFTHNVALSAPSTGHCNTIGTATTMVRHQMRLCVPS